MSPTHQAPSSLTLRLFVFLAAVAQPLVSASTQLGWLGRPIGAVSDKNLTFITPADYAFSVWGLIFLLCIVYAVLQLKKSHQVSAVYSRSRVPLLVAMLANTAWMAAFALQVAWLPLLLIWMMLVALLVGLRRLRVVTVPFSWQSVLVRALMSIFAGWLSIAAFANLSVAALESGLVTASALATLDISFLLVAGGLILVVNRLEKGNDFYAATVMWGLVAIAINQWHRVENAGAVAALLACALLIAVAIQTAWLKSPMVHRKALQD